MTDIDRGSLEDVKESRTSTVNTVCTLLLGAISDGGAELDDAGLIGDLLGLGNGIIDTLEVTGPQDEKGAKIKAKGISYLSPSRTWMTCHP